MKVTLFTTHSTIAFILEVLKSASQKMLLTEMQHVLKIHKFTVRCTTPLQESNQQEIRICMAEFLSLAVKNNPVFADA